MGQLIVWTAGHGETLKKTIGRTLENMRPNIPIHRFEGYVPGNIVKPAAEDIVLLCGTKPLDELKEAKILKKNQSLNSLRQIPHRYGDGYYMVSFDPQVVANEPEKGTLLDWDVRLAVRFLHTGSLLPQLGEYKWVSSFAPLIARIEAKFAETNSPVDVSGDSETMGLHPWYDGKDLLVIGFTDRPGFAEALYLGNFFPAPVPIAPNEDLRGQVEWLLNSPKVKLRGSNFKYDLMWIAEKTGIECTNLKFDNALVGGLLNENRSNSLNLHAKVYTEMGGYDDEFNRTVDKNHMELVPLDKMLPYVGADIDASFRVADKLRAELLKDPEAARFYVNILHPASRAFEKIERRGIHVDLEEFASVDKDLDAVIADSTAQAMDLLPNKIRYKHIEKIADQQAEGKSPLTPKILFDYFFTPQGLNLKPILFTEKTKQPSTARAHLRMFSNNPAAKAMCDAMEVLQSASKTKSTFVTGFLKHLRPDGMLHPSYMLHHGDFNNDEDDESGSVSGRLSAKEPAIQCMVGETRVLTRKGWVCLGQIVHDYGLGHQVLTHSGQWRDVVGVYRNGHKPVFRVTTKSGYEFKATGNHPILTTAGWVKVDRLQVGARIYEIPRAFSESWENENVSQLGGYEVPLPRSEQFGLPELRWSGDQDRSEMGVVRRIFRRHGGGADRAHVGTEEGERGLQQSQLLLATEGEAGAEHQSNALGNVSRPDALPERMVSSQRHHAVSISQEEAERLVRRRLAGDAGSAYDAGFEIGEIASVELIGERETFDITIDQCHSFVAEGVVVHNTLPKKTKWAKRLRKCFIAPPGKTLVNIDFSQGELRVVACIAPEENMINAYMQGLDLHAVTGAKLGGYSLDAFLKMKDTDKHTYDLLRDKAKPANFGLLYGMGAEGFQAYCWAQFGLALTLDEATEMREAFFELYPGLLAYHDDMRKFVRAYEYVISPLGRKRHLETIRSWDRKVRSQAERQAINSPVQSTLTDMMIWSLAEIDQELPEDKFAVVCMIHDCLIAYADTATAPAYAKQAADIMTNRNFSMFDWKPQLEFPADREWGPNLADLSKMPLAA